MAVFFNKDEFNNIKHMINENPFKTIKLLSSYIDKYPNDYFAHAYYAYILIIIGDFTTSEEILTKIEELIKYDKKFNIDKTKYNNLISLLEFYKIKLYSYTNRFNEIYNMLHNNQEKIDYLDVNSIYNIAKAKTNRLSDIELSTFTYKVRQAQNYSELSFKYHINKHLENYGFTENSTYNKDFDIDKIYNHIKSNINNYKKLYRGFYEDTYSFKYDNCGKVNNIMTDYFICILFHNTTNFITMYPISMESGLLYNDLNYLRTINTSNKVKKISRIDRFNNRYKQN